MPQITKGPDGRYYKECPECGETQSYLRKNYAVESLKLKKLCKGCSNKKPKTGHLGWYRGIRLSWLNKIRCSAETRGKTWYLDADNLADLFEEQNKKCALTGWPLRFPETGKSSDSDVSIDRIDNSKGYEIGNVQLVNKAANMMKQMYTQEEFVRVCVAVAGKHKDSPKYNRDKYW